MKLLFLVILSSIVFTGCASKRNFAELPEATEDFRLPARSLEQKYPEINSYKAGNSKFGWCTPVKQLEQKWGVPDEINTVWVQVPALALPIFFLDGITTGGLVGAVMVYTMTPKQPEHYIWKKGNYSIDAFVGVNIFCDYEKHVLYWDWLETEK